jgi:hypothetical protein
MVLGAALAAFTAGAALACMGHTAAQHETKKPDTQQSTVTSDKK